MFEDEGMAFAELTRKVEGYSVLKIFRKVIFPGAWCFWGSGLYNEMGDAIKRWIVEPHLRNLDFI